jgi:hypothetical protein
MGFSITADKAAKLDRNRREGRLCGGPTRDRAGCASRATWQVVEEVWTHRLGVGRSRVNSLLMCKRHAMLFHSGYCGVNFRVIEIAKLDMVAQGW